MMTIALVALVSPIGSLAAHDEGMIDVSMCGGVLCAVTCVSATRDILFDVTFSAHWENAVLIIRDSDGHTRSFNNYFKNGAGPEWESGPDTYPVASGNAACYRIIAQHKTGPPDGGLPWHRTVRFTVNENVIGFEDGGDGSFDDARVKVSIK